MLQDAAAALRNLAMSSDAAAAAIAGVDGGAGALRALARCRSTHAALLDSGAVERLETAATAEDEATAVRIEARGALALLWTPPVPGAEPQLSSPCSTNGPSILN